MTMSEERKDNPKSGRFLPSSNANIHVPPRAASPSAASHLSNPLSCLPSSTFTPRILIPGDLERLRLSGRSWTSGACHLLPCTETVAAGHQRRPCTWVTRVGSATTVLNLPARVSAARFQERCDQSKTCLPRGHRDDVFLAPQVSHTEMGRLSSWTPWSGLMCAPCSSFNDRHVDGGAYLRTRARKKPEVASWGPTHHRALPPRNAYLPSSSRHLCPGCSGTVSAPTWRHWRKSCRQGRASHHKVRRRAGALWARPSSPLLSLGRAGEPPPWQGERLGSGAQA